MVAGRRKKKMAPDLARFREGGKGDSEKGERNRRERAAGEAPPNFRSNTRLEQRGEREEVVRHRIGIVRIPHFGGIRGGGKATRGEEIPFAANKEINYVGRHQSNAIKNRKQINGGRLRFRS